MACFEKAVEKTLLHEGIFSKHENDRGGTTRFGISQKSYPDINIASLSRSDAVSIYRKDYWDALSLDSVQSQRIAEELFDTAVNMGVRQSVKIAQRALNFLGAGTVLAVDGVLGPLTRSALDQWGWNDPEALFTALNGYQFALYEQIVSRDSSQQVFARGWMRRIQAYREGHGGAHG